MDDDVTTEPGAKKAESNFTRGLVLFPLSLIPLAFTLAVMRLRFLQRLMAAPLWIGVFTLGYFAGKGVYKLFRRDEREDDILAFIAACIFGFGVALLVRSLFSHEIARAFAWDDAQRDED